MQVREAMSTTVLTIGPGHTLREASRQMAIRHVGAAVVHDPDGEGIGILTERDVLQAIGAGQDPDGERVSDHLTGELVFAAPSWTLDQAAEAMTRGGFRHLVVLDEGEVAGIVSVRDIVRCWSKERSTNELVG
ncbi:MAG: CBS domain-containing protein [Actinomycetes bacterium]